MEAHYPFTLPPLPYGYDALLPEIGERTLHFHHDKHFQTYVDNLNKLLEKHPDAQDWPLERLVQEWPSLPEDIRQGVRNNAGGVYNHDLYFKTLASGPVTAPEGPLAAVRGPVPPGGGAVPPGYFGLPDGPGHYPGAAGGHSAGGGPVPAAGAAPGAVHDRVTVLPSAESTAFTSVGLSG